MERSEAIQIVKGLVQGRTVRRNHPLTDHTSIYSDLRLYGDDAYEILAELHRRFGIDFSQFRFDAYFPREGGFGPWFQRLLGKTWKPLTLGHLAAVVERGKWFEPGS